MYTDKLFTGQREMAGLGIYHYGARFYSPKLGRFLSADTIVPGYANPQNLNRFSYVRNNPLRYTDPTGHLIDEGCGCEGTGRRTSPIVMIGGRRTRDTDGTPSVVPQEQPIPLPGPIVEPTDPRSETHHYGADPVVGSDETEETTSTQSPVEILDDLLNPVIQPSGLPIFITIEPVDPSDFGVLPTIWHPRNPRDWQALGRLFGIDPQVLRRRVERCKQRMNIPPNINVGIDDETGDIIDHNGEVIGNVDSDC